MLVRWAEADQIVKLDPSASEDRTEAQVHAMDRLGGALERRFPEASARTPAQERELYHRACDGWEVVVLSGHASGREGRDHHPRARRDLLESRPFDDPVHPRAGPEARSADAASVRPARRDRRHPRDLARDAARAPARPRPRQAQLVHHVDARRRLPRRPHARPDLLPLARVREAAVVDLPPLRGAQLVRRLHRRVHRHRALEVLRGRAGPAHPGARLHAPEVPEARACRCRSCRSRISS